MPESTVSTAVVVASALIVMAAGALIAFYYGRRAATSDDWIVGGRSLPLRVVVFSQFATASGGGVLVAHVGIGYAWGWSVLVYELACTAGFLLLVLLAKWLRSQEFDTVPQVLSRLFGRDTKVVAIAALCSIVVPFGWLATQFVAFARLFSQLTGMSLPVLIAVMAVASLLFVLPGGLLSVAWSDYIFGVFMLVVTVFVVGYAVYAAGGVGAITTTVPEELWSPSSITLVGWPTILLWVFAIVPGTLTNQLYYQRIFATKDMSNVRRSLVVSGVMMLIAGVYAGVLGLAVRAMGADFSVAERELAAGWFIGQLPLWVMAIFSGFLVATIVSTTSSALHSVTTNLVRDLYQNIRGGDRPERELVRMSQLITVGVTVTAALLAIAFPRALDWLVATYAYSAATLAVPIFVGFALRNRVRLTPGIALTAMGSGLVGCAAAHIIGTEVPYAVYGIVVSLVGMLVAVAVQRGARGGDRTPAPTA
ncbi:sodium:solute symporter family protein [Streptomonospora sp. S1-112]|uniref:Sodium:solute symporter family protein n=1 Tax=Streptomonospora mangrovi TaxID=2883123 RepID=A0A9X3SLS3_9ACTN|nr:sodium:solute symporter family protein [Streptomonospora mangrovi]MDA0563636.1 sodium:solute symporter family protein [Streptomonospora mangrovi]